MIDMSLIVDDVKKKEISVGIAGITFDWKTILIVALTLGIGYLILKKGGR